MNLRYTEISSRLCQPVADLIKVCFPLMPESDQYTAEDLEEMVEVFPEGTIVVIDEDTDRVIGMGTGIFTDVNFDELPPTEHDLLYDEADESRHDPDGDYYYGSDIAVHPDYRGHGISREIYNRRKALLIRHNKKGFAAAAVLPGYMAYKANLDAPTYVAKVISGEIFDPTLSVQIRNGFDVIRPLKDYFQYPKSDNWSALILWKNREYREAVE